jgi:hypothetical protein
MKVFHITAFDENIAGTGGVWYSRQEHSDRLALADMLVMHAVASNVTGTAGVVVRVEHSANGQNWVNVSSGTGAEIVNTDIVGTANSFGAVSGLTQIMLAYTRLKVTLTGTSPQCRLKIMVTGRSY